MASYSYVAKNAAGEIHRGVSEAESESVLVRRLQEQGYWVQQVSASKGQGGKQVPATTSPGVAPAKATARKRGGGLLLFGRVGSRDLTLFCRQFATMINAGVTLVRCLSVLEEQSTNQRLRQVIREVQVGVEGGETLSRALQRFPRIFSPLFVGLVRAGEVGGVLDETLARLATFLEENEKLKRKIKSAMAYPVVVMVFALAIVIGLVTFVVPAFLGVFKDLDVKEMPLPTIIMMSISGFFTGYWYILIGVVVALVVGFTRYIRTRTGKRQWDWFKIKTPVFGKLNHKIAISRFSRTLSTLLTSGVAILNAMETVAGSLDNEIIGEAIMQSRASIREGSRIGDPLEKSGLFPPMVVQMISIGEETGSLDSMLSKIADFYESEVDAALQTLASAIEPILIVFLGVVVLGILIAVWMPMISIINTLSQSGG